MEKRVDFVVSFFSDSQSDGKSDVNGWEAGDALAAAVAAAKEPELAIFSNSSHPIELMPIERWAITDMFSDGHTFPPRMPECCGCIDGIRGECISSR